MTDEETRKYLVAARPVDDERTAVSLMFDPHFALETGCDPHEQRSFVVPNKVFEGFEDDLKNSKIEYECRHAIDEFVRRAEASGAA